MSRTAAPREVLVATDLDGTLLDHDSYEFTAAAEALASLRARGARLVFVTSKTAAETAALAQQLAGPIAAIVENGGALVAPPSFWPHGASRPAVLPLGAPRGVLVGALDSIRRETGAALTGFAELGVREVAALTGLPLEHARLALEREYDEPFLLRDDSLLPAVTAAAAARGFVVTTGGRFHHLTGPTDKGSALRLLLGMLAEHQIVPVTIGLGDAPNDLSFLQVVDRPIIVPRPSGEHHPTLGRALPAARRAALPGPAGWNLAVLEVLRSLDP